MKIGLLSFILLAIITFGLQLCPNTSGEHFIENRNVKVTFNATKGTYDIFHKLDQQYLVRDAIFQIHNHISTEYSGQFDVEIETVENSNGRGQSLSIRSVSAGKPNVLLRISVYHETSFIELVCGVENSTPKVFRLKEMLVIEADIFPELPLLEHVKILDGNAGGGDTRVTDTLIFMCHNNALITFKADNEQKSLVLGGLSYSSYEKQVSIFNHRSIRLYASDSVGRLIRPGESYWADQDKFYINFMINNPFEALEYYALALKDEQKIELNPYTFPTVCMWYVNYNEYGGQTGVNDSKGAVEEMQHIKASGFLEYAGTVGVRLVPDNYGYNNQQGWWDNEHFAKYGSTFHTPVIPGHLKAPYETLEKFGNAIKELGGLPFLYVQTSWRSEDYAQQFPSHMLFNKSYARRDNPISEEVIVPLMHEATWNACDGGENNIENPGRNRLYYGYDFTDPGFSLHMGQVYENMGQAGIAGIMYDYPWSGWADQGGMDDTITTSTAAYRRIFKLAEDGLGRESWIHERCIERPSDVTLGIVESQRTMWDNDKLTGESVSKSGLRWYKNRVVINYDADAKNILASGDELRTILTMSYVTSGRLLLGVSFGAMNQEQLHCLSRIYPFHRESRSSRPVDAFFSETPHVYDFKVNEDWHQLTLFNDNYQSEMPFEVLLSGNQVEGALGLSTTESYHIYDFWNDAYVGKITGDQSLRQNLRKGESRMLSIHKAVKYPQFISVNRHIMQGYLSLKKQPVWNPEEQTLAGESLVVKNDPYEIVFAINGKKLKSVHAGNIQYEVSAVDSDIVKVVFISEISREIKWKIHFSTSL